MFAWSNMSQRIIFGFTSGAWGFSNSSLGISLAINFLYPQPLNCR